MKSEKKIKLNEELFFASKDDFEAKAIEIIEGQAEIETLIKNLKITRQEILDNLVSFINLKESLENSKIYPWNYSLNRNKNGKLIFKKRLAKNDYNFFVTRPINLWLTEISNPKDDAKLDKIRTSNSSRKRFYDYTKILARDISHKKHKDSKGFYVYGSENMGKSYLAQAAANYFASEGISTAYITTSSLFDFLKSNFNGDTNLNSDVISKLKNVNALIIDELGLEPKNKWFRLEVLLSIIDERMIKNKLTFFFSPIAPNELEKYYLKQISDEPLRVKSLVHKILDNSIDLFIDEEY